jgi:phospholipid/cholesterol/gamma-HCH transport system permease protein
VTLTRELAPVFTALMVTARACSSMAAELGTMKVTEQIDALETMAVNPIHYLVVPRVFAAMVMTPMLSMVFTVVGVIGSYFVAVYLLEIPSGPYMHNLYYYVHTEDLYGGLVKAAYSGLSSRSSAVMKAM